MAQNDDDNTLMRLLHKDIVHGVFRRVGLADEAESFVRDSALHAGYSTPQAGNSTSGSGNGTSNETKSEPYMENDHRNTKDEGINTSGSQSCNSSSIINIGKVDETVECQKSEELHSAVVNGQFDRVENLLLQGCNQCSLDTELKTPLHHVLYVAASYRYDHKNISETLWQALICETSINRMDNRRNYPIDIAAGMKTKPLPLPVLHKLMSHTNMSSHTLVKLVVITGADEFLDVLNFAMPFFRPKDIKFGEWKAFIFDTLDEVYANSYHHVTLSNRMLLRHCVNSDRNIDEVKIEELINVLWNAGYCNIATFTEQTNVFGTKLGSTVFTHAAAPLLRNPRQLMDLCRIFIRNNIKDLSDSSFASLKIPKILLTYLTFNKIQ